MQVVDVEPSEPQASSSGAPAQQPDRSVDKATNNSEAAAEEQNTSNPSQQYVVLPLCCSMQQFFVHVKSLTPPNPLYFLCFRVHKPVQPPEIVASQFQGGSPQRSRLTLDNAVWARPLTAETVLEDLVLDCSLPQSLQLAEDCEDTADIGKWGEQLVHSFLTHWRERASGPREITWYNQSGESGQPCDFKLTFENGQGVTRDVFVEVKTTVKWEKHFIHLSANELDFALKEKEKYHIYRVYGAGDSQNVRLCRVQNLAQHLHSKTLELFLFV